MKPALLTVATRLRSGTLQRATEYGRLLREVGYAPAGAPLRFEACAAAKPA